MLQPRGRATDLLYDRNNYSLTIVYPLSGTDITADKDNFFAYGTYASYPADDGTMTTVVTAPATPVTTPSNYTYNDPPGTSDNSWCVGYPPLTKAMYNFRVQDTIAQVNGSNSLQENQ